RQLLDAVESLNLDWPTNLAATVGPLIAPADGKLQRALTTLDDGEQWLVAPQQLDDAGRSWRAGVRAGGRPGAEFAQTEAVGPGAKAGGPNYVAQLGQWQQVNGPKQLGDIGPRVGEFLDATAPWLGPEERDWLRESARSDAHARDVYRTPVDVSGLRSETNVFRYRPGPRMTIRAGENAPLVQVFRLSAAALAAGVDAGVSVAPAVFAALPQEVRRAW